LPYLVINMLERMFLPNIRAIFYCILVEMYQIQEVNNLYNEIIKNPVLIFFKLVYKGLKLHTEI
jgi:hypothetical protein